MDRRRFFKMLSGVSLLSLPWLPSVAKAFSASRALRGKRQFFLIQDTYSAVSPTFFSVLDKLFAKSQPDWQRDLVVLDIAADKEKVAQIIALYGPNTETFDWPLLIAVPAGQNTPADVEVWSMEWLNHQKTLAQDPACYPVSGGWWSVDGSWRPSWQKVRNHLYQSPNHSSGHFEDTWLDQLSFAELQSVHSDHHREMVDEGAVWWGYVNQECPQ